MVQLFHPDSCVGVLPLHDLSAERGPSMIANIMLGVLLVAGVASVAVLALRQRFTAHLDRLEAELQKPGQAQVARSDLPAEVVALAERMGARGGSASEFSVFDQSGQMWQTPGGKPTDFTVRQTVRFGAPGVSLAGLRWGQPWWRTISSLGPAAWR